MLHDRVLIRRVDEPPKGIVLTDADKSQIGVVVAVGPGKWIPGEWWCVGGKWEWFDGYRDDWGVRAGDHVLFQSKWDDLSRHAERGDLHYLQIADILGLMNA